MNIDIKKIFAPITDYYDKVFAVIMMAMLLASILLLSVRAVVAKQDQLRFIRELDNLKPVFPTVAPNERGPFDKGMRDFEKPAFLDASEESKLFMVPERRVECVKCRKPIMYDAATCVFCGHEQPSVEGIVSPEKDSDGDGMPDVWEIKHGLNINNFDDAAADTDKDGWSNVEEYKANLISKDTNPRDPAEFPPPWSFNKLVVNVTTSMQFNLTFMSAMKSPTGFTFQINHLEGRTYWKKMGEKVLGFTIKNYQEKTEPDRVITNKKNDVSELTLESADRTVVLIKGKKMQQHEKSAILTFLPDAKSIPVIEGKDFEVRGHKFRVKGIDVSSNKVVITDPLLGRDVSIGPSGFLN